jgi:glyoxylase-like metal-dependent hydrolase (beta-lactamase superfamily II)
VKKFLMLTISLLFAVSAHAQTDFSKIEVKATKVAGNVYMLQGGGGNIGVSVGDDGILIVDDQYAPLADKIKAALKGIADKRLRFILNTPVIAHDNVRKRLSTEQKSTVFNRTTPPAPKEALPVITFNESLTVHFNGEEIRVIHFPQGHTDGDSVIFFTASNVVHLGDDFFAGRFPFVDLESGGTVAGLIKNIGELIGRIPADAKLIPGHGPISTLDDLKSYHRMLQQTTEIVRQKIAAGKTVEQVKTEGLPAEWAPWGVGFIKTDRWVETIYRSLTAKK